MRSNINEIQWNTVNEVDLVQCPAQEKLLYKARAYLYAMSWCDKIIDEFVGCYIPNNFAIFLFRIEGKHDLSSKYVIDGNEVDEFIWVISGKVPSLYITTDYYSEQEYCDTPQKAYSIYRELFVKWCQYILQDIKIYNGPDFLSEISDEKHIDRKFFEIPYLAQIGLHRISILDKWFEKKYDIIKSQIITQPLFLNNNRSLGSYLFRCFGIECSNWIDIGLKNIESSLNFASKHQLVAVWNESCPPEQAFWTYADRVNVTSIALSKCIPLQNENVSIVSSNVKNLYTVFSNCPKTLHLNFTNHFFLQYLCLTANAETIMINSSSLQELVIPRLFDYPLNAKIELHMLPNLKKITYERNGIKSKIPFWVKSLKITTPPLDFYSWFEDQSQLEELCIIGGKWNSLEWIKKFTKLKILHLENCRQLNDISALSQLQLQWLRIHGCNNITDFSVLSVLPLRGICFSQRKSINDIKFLKNIRTLEMFSVNNSPIKSNQYYQLDTLPFCNIRQLLTKERLSKNRHYQYAFGGYADCKLEWFEEEWEL